MNFVLLGDDAIADQCVRAVVQSPNNRLTHAVRAESLLARTTVGGESIRLLADWQELAGGIGVDAVIVAGADADLLDAARHLAATRIPLLVFPAIGMESTFLYELGLIHDDCQVLLCPGLPLRTDPVVEHLQRIVRSPDFGSIVRLRIDRSMPSAQPGLAGDSDRSSRIDHELLIDADLLRHFGGDYDQVTALQSLAADGTIAVKSVMLAGADLPGATWVCNFEHMHQWNFELTGTNQSALLSQADSGRLILQHRSGTDPPERFEGEGDSGVRLLDRFSAMCRGQSNDADRQASRTEWSELVRAFEVVDAARRSLKRRRTVDLYFESTSERSLFKTQMSAMGCGVLSWTIVGLIAYLIFATLFEVPMIVLQIARVLWIAPVVVFLLLQFLLVLARPESTRTDRS